MNEKAVLPLLLVAPNDLRNALVRDAEDGRDVGHRHAVAVGVPDRCVSIRAQLPRVSPKFALAPLEVARERLQPDLRLR